MAEAPRSAYDIAAAAEDARHHDLGAGGSCRRRGLRVSGPRALLPGLEGFIVANIVLFHVRLEIV